MKSGIAPKTLGEQVENTASWLFTSEDPRALVVANILRARDVADGDKDAAGPDYLRYLLTSHFATVATFVPTDVDARIRHHAWVALEDEAQLSAACDVVDEVAAWDARLVSARTIESSRGPVSGHDGEWLAVRAGALGRAAALGASATVERLTEALDRELDREEAAFEEALATNDAARAFAAATVLAHNLGDLSRVVDQWPGKTKPELAVLHARYVRLGHGDAASPRASFTLAGTMNKALTALENHRFLALRKPRALRGSRDLLLPIGPWFDGWGETIAKHASLEDRDRVEVAAALLEIHLSSPEQLGCLRALAGMHRATKGGLELYVPDLPARLRKEALRGKVREAVDVSPSHFASRIQKRFEQLRRG